MSDIEDAMKRAVRQGYEESAREFKRLIAGLERSHGGKPVDEVKGAVRAAFRRADISASESEITDYATAISEGTKIDMKVEPLRF